jgi:hypothetical protein
LVLIAVLSLATTTQAGGFYVGGSIGQSSFKDLTVDDISDGSLIAGSVDDSDTAWKLFAGFRFLKFLTAEVDYRDYGQASIAAASDGSGSVYAPGPVDALGDLTAFTVSAMGVLPLGRFDIFGKVGFVRWNLESSVFNAATGRLRDDDAGNDALYGVGGAFRFAGSFGVRLEYERISVDDSDVDLFSGGVHWRF